MVCKRSMEKVNGEMKTLIIASMRLGVKSTDYFLNFKEGGVGRHQTLAAQKQGLNARWGGGVPGILSRAARAHLYPCSVLVLLCATKLRSTNLSQMRCREAPDPKWPRPRPTPNTLHSCTQARPTSRRCSHTEI